MWITQGLFLVHSRYTIGHRPRVLLIVLLISDDLRLFQGLVNAEDNFKSSSPVENKRHTNAHQPSPPAQQQRIQSPPLRQILASIELGESAFRFRRVIAWLLITILSLQYVLENSLRENGNHIRLTSQLIQVKDQVDPLLKSLRHAPRYAALLKKLNLPN